MNFEPSENHVETLTDVSTALFCQSCLVGNSTLKDLSNLSWGISMPGDSEIIFCHSLAWPEWLSCNRLDDEASCSGNCFYVGVRDHGSDNGYVNPHSRFRAKAQIRLSFGSKI